MISSWHHHQEANDDYSQVEHRLYFAAAAATATFAVCAHKNQLSLFLPANSTFKPFTDA